MQVYNLIVEVTRRCNADCEHCLRGDAENLDLDLKFVDSLFQKIDYISTITFTGGEPTLAVDKIDGVLRLAKKHRVEVNSFYIATNAIYVPDSFLLACMEWFVYCDDNETTQVQWSNDRFHCLDDTAVKRLQALGFSSPKYEKETGYILHEGRGRKFDIEYYPSPTVYLEDEVVEGEVYLNCKGEIIDGCDWSYESQPKYRICGAEDFSYEAVASYIKERGEI